MMKVRELIEELERIEDKDLNVVVFDEYGYWDSLTLIFESELNHTIYGSNKKVTEKCLKLLP